MLQTQKFSSLSCPDKLPSRSIEMLNSQWAIFYSGARPSFWALHFFLCGIFFSSFSLLLTFQNFSPSLPHSHPPSPFSPFLSTYFLAIFGSPSRSGPSDAL